MKRIIILGCIAIVAISFVACDKDKSGDEPQNKEKKIAISTTVKNPDGKGGLSFLQLLDDFTEQSVDNKKAVPIPSATTVQLYDKHLFVFPGFDNNSKPQLIKYSYDNGVLKQAGILALPNNSIASSFIGLNEQKAYLSMWGLGKILIFNPQTMTKTGEIDLSEYGVDDKNPEPACAIIRDGLLYVGLNQAVGGFLPKPDRTFSDVAIIDTKTDKPIKMITEKESGLSNSTRPIDIGTIFIDENNDIYIACMGSFGYIPNHKSGFLRIKSGETEFDKDYSWYIGETPIDDEPNKANWIASTRYVDNGKAFGYVNIKAYEGDSPYLSKSSVAVEFDLKNKTMKRIKGIPNSNNHSCWISQYNDLMVFSNYGDTSGGFYSYNPKTGEVSKGPVITTTGNPNYFMKL